VKLEQVDAVGAEPPQRRLDRADQPRPRRAPVLRAVTHRQAGLGRDEDGIAPPLDRLAEHLFRRTVRIDVGGVEQRDAGVEADVDQPPRLGGVACAPGAEQRPLTTERARAERQHGNAQAGRSQLPIFHDTSFGECHSSGA
jgi:hypothetical protein